MVVPLSAGLPGLASFGAASNAALAGLFTAKALAPVARHACQRKSLRLSVWFIDGALCLGAKDSAMAEERLESQCEVRAGTWAGKASWAADAMDC